MDSVGKKLAFDRDEVSKLLVEVHRRCCICHRLCGTKIETDHIIPVAEGGKDKIENAIPVCFECHAEIHSYNDKHPRGRKFTPNKLRDHKAQWLKICGDNPGALLASSRTADVGPLQALIDELEFNFVVCRDRDKRGALLNEEQFRRAVTHGAIAILESGLKEAILQAYVAASRANQLVLAEINQDFRSSVTSGAGEKSKKALEEAERKVTAAHNFLLDLLGSEIRRS